MSTVNEHTPLLHQAHHEQQDQHLDIRYPIVTVKELNQRVDELVNSTTDDQGLSDLVAHGGDAAFYVVVNSLLLQPLDKHNLLESWAIKVLEILLQDQRDKYHTRIRHILLHEWEDQGSALDIVLQLPDWTILLCKPVQDGINAIWAEGRPIMTDLTAVNKITRITMLYIGKWRSPKYQALLQFITGAIYVSLYLATVANQNYTNFPPHAYEYVFYVFALSDLILETLNFLSHPRKCAVSIKAILAILSAYVILASFIWRILGLTTRSLPNANRQLHVSYVCLAVISPIMLVRLMLYARPFSAVSRIEIQLCRCLVEASWVLAVGVIVLLGFWVAVAAINTDKTAGEILQLLALGALFAPEIGDTLLYEPQVIGILLFVYLFFTTILLSSLLTASFLATFLSLRNQLENLVARQFAALTVNMLKAGGGSGIGSYIPGALVECILIYPLACLVKIYKIYARYRMNRSHYEQSYQKAQKISQYLHRWREIVFFTTYSPIFMTATLIEMLVDMARNSILYLQRVTETSLPPTLIQSHA